MKTLYLDCSMGAAGDMLSGALLDLMPDGDAALAELNSFGIPGTTFHMETVAKCSIASTRLSVLVQGHEEGDAHADAGHSHHGHHEHRSLEDVLRVIDGLSLDAAVKDDVAKVYRLVAEAESRVHGKEVGEVHFHEVGATKSARSTQSPTYRRSAISFADSPPMKWWRRRYMWDSGR